MAESTPELAFLFGLISAASLPIGAVTARLWVPTDREIAFLMAFGGGALLAALSVDLVASALEHGQLYPLAIGWMFGGLFFILLNEVINNFGGFMRKVSTTMYHLRRQHHRQVRRMLADLRDMEVFRDLPLREVKALAASVQQSDYKSGARLYEVEDPGEALYIVADGVIELLDPKEGMRSIKRLEKNAVFGQMAFFTSTFHTNIARASTDASVWMVPKTAFTALLPNSPTLIQAVRRWLRSAPVEEYLIQGHGMKREDARLWCDMAVQSLLSRGTIPSAQKMAREAERFSQRAPHFQRFRLFNDLPPDELGMIASRLVHKGVFRGYTFFHQGEPPDRMFIVDRGEVSLIDPTDVRRTPTLLGSDDIFGAMAFLTGARHSVTAIASQDTYVWVLRRGDFEDLLHQAPEFEQRVRAVVGGGEVGTYLEHKQHFDPDKAQRWIREALKSMGSGAPLPTARDMSVDVSEHKGAPLAIWLGILLDAIPEGLVIGSTMVGTHVSMSLLAGLFISNYPEALSSSAAMKQQGFSFGRILLMWSSIALATGLLAAAGNVFLIGAPQGIFALIQGMAAGAMLTMIAQTMLPEAYFKGGSIIGLATMLGFLAAVLCKAFE